MFFQFYFYCSQAMFVKANPDFKIMILQTNKKKHLDESSVLQSHSETEKKINIDFRFKVI